MTATLDESFALLERTPLLLDAWLRPLPEAWTGGGSREDWGPFDVLGHLVHCERVDWVQRAQRILTHGPGKPFDPVDRMAQFELAAGRALPELLDEFAGLRRTNLATVRALALTADDLAREGTHPALGRVTLGQLLATWTAHDLDHVTQIARFMARRLKDAVGPWREYLPIVR